MAAQRYLYGQWATRWMSDSWMGAKCFGLGGALAAVIALALFAFEGWLGDQFRNPFFFLMVAGFVFLFFNVLGTLLSVVFLITGKSREDKVAGLVGLVLNLLPYLGFLML